MIITELQKQKTRFHTIKGKCAHCAREVWESELTLDDCYNVWAGRCPDCQAINMLALTSLRGYSSQGMDLVLPFDEEIESNEMLKNMDPKPPTQGKSSRPCDIPGTISGLLADVLLNDPKTKKQ